MPGKSIKGLRGFRTTVDNAQDSEAQITHISASLDLVELRLYGVNEKIGRIFKEGSDGDYKQQIIDDYLAKGWKPVNFQYNNHPRSSLMIMFYKEANGAPTL
jgi:hypothetical protein